MLRRSRAIIARGFNPWVCVLQNRSPGRGDVGDVTLIAIGTKILSEDNIAPTGAGVVVAMGPGVKTPGYGCFAPSELGIGTMV